jgi:hypothetical protein
MAWGCELRRRLSRIDQEVMDDCGKPSPVAGSSTVESLRSRTILKYSGASMRDSPSHEAACTSGSGTSPNSAATSSASEAVMWGARRIR